jgi:hypothetical protein
LDIDEPELMVMYRIMEFDEQCRRAPRALQKHHASKQFEECKQKT